MDLVNYTILNDIAVIEVNNPPVNALGKNVRLGLQDAFLRARNNDKVSAIVLCGKRMFLGGADLKEFAQGVFTKPSLVDVVEMIEASSRPVVAAIQGFAFGGGMEVAIACHYRVAHVQAKFGFPEVDLGILPGATGTQRFPRLVGLKAALDLIPTGRRIGTKEALTMGALDKVVDKDLLQEAVMFARSVAKQPLAGRRTSKLDVKDKELATGLRDAAVTKANKRWPGMQAPIFSINAVMAATEYPYEQGLQQEKEMFSLLFTSGQAFALQYAFFAQRAVTKWEVPGVGSFKTAKPQQIKTCAVIGAGTKGVEIVITLLNGGIPVVLVDQTQELLDQAVAMIRKFHHKGTGLGMISASQAEATLRMLRPTLNVDNIRNVDLVVEAVSDDLHTKRKVFAELDSLCSPHTILSSSTHCVSIDKIAMATQRVNKTIGLHFLAPAYHTKLLEVIRADKTSAETIAAAMTLGGRLGKVPVLVGNGPGFAWRRVTVGYTMEAEFLVEDGCLPEEVDGVARDFGFTIGPLTALDFMGLDNEHSVMVHMEKLLKPKESSVNSRKGFIIADLVQHGHLGRKTGMGFFNYGQPGGKVAVKDPWVDRHILQLCRQHDIARRRVPAQEIEDRLMLSVVNEAFKILGEGLVRTPEDIDIMWLLGLGFPRYLGGPMYWSNTIGIKKVYDKIGKYHRRYPDSAFWQPAEMLRMVAVDDVPMKKWHQYSGAQMTKTSRL